MIFSPWPMILRSLPMTDFSPPDGALIDRCAPLAPAGRVVRGSSDLGSAVDPRVNIKAPDQTYVRKHRTDGNVTTDPWWNCVESGAQPRGGRWTSLVAGKSKYSARVRAKGAGMERMRGPTL